MALRGSDVDSDALRSAGAGFYLNHYHRTRAWVGADERSYAPGELLRGTAYLKNNPHPSRRQLVLSQVDVYLSPETARRKRNFTHETRGGPARRQNLTDICYVRRTGPAGSGTYRSYYHYGETIPPSESPFRGPFQAQFHFRSNRFMGASSNDRAASDISAADDEDDDDASSSETLSDHIAVSPAAAAARRSHDLAAAGIIEFVPPTFMVQREPLPIRHCVFKASRDGGPRTLPSAHSETAFRFQLRIPPDAPENYAWAETKEGRCIEIRYRLYVVFKLRAQPHNPIHAADPLFWEGAARTGEHPLIVLFSENFVGVDAAPDSVPRLDVYRKYATPNGPVPLGYRPRPKRRSFLGRRSLSIELVGDSPHRIGHPLHLRVQLRCPRSVTSAVSDGDSETGSRCRFKVELIERAVLRQGRKTSISKSVRTLTCTREVEPSGLYETIVAVATDSGDIYPTSRIGGMLVYHSVRVTLCPGQRFSITAQLPVVMAPGTGRYLVRQEHNEILYPQRARQPVWRRERSRRLERERKKRETVAALVDSMPECTATQIQADASDDEEEDVCAICLDEMTAKKAVVLPCAHVMHAECIKDWIFQKSECPICKTAMQ